jgi:hypothetical protein
MTVRQQYVGDVEFVPVSRCYDLIDFPGGVDHCASATGDILDQVNEILHRTKFHGVNFESGIWHEFLAGF